MYIHNHNSTYMQVENIPGICESIIHNVLHKRKLYLDAFTEGLAVFQLRTAIATFPELFKELLVATDVCSSSDVLDILHFHTNLGPEEQRLITSFNMPLGS